MGLLLLPVVAIAAVVALATGAPGRRVATWAGAAVAGLIALTVLELGLIVGLRGQDENSDESSDAPTTAVTTSDPAATRPPPEPAAVREVDAVLLPPRDEGPFPSPQQPISGLRDGDLLLVEAALERDGELRQCAAGAPNRSACGEGVPVPEPFDGTARFLAPVAATLPTPTGDADCIEQTCVLVLFGAGDGEVVARLPLAFGDAVRTPEIVLGDDGPFDDGDAVQVSLVGFTPGEEVVVTLCTPPGPTDASVCGAPAPEVAVRIPPGGEVVLPFPIQLGPVGVAGKECRRAEPCAVGVLGSSGDAPTAEISLAGSPASDVASGRVAWGVGVAALLAVAALVLLIRGDWHGPDGDPFFGIKLTVPEGWEHLRDDFEDDDGADTDDTDDAQGAVRE